MWNDADRPATLQHFFWIHPEWWSLALCGVGWVVMLLHGGRHAGHEVHQAGTLGDELPRWMWMVAAMMLPRLTYEVRGTAERSLWARRHRAIAGFLTGFGIPWLGLGIIAVLLRRASWPHTYAAPALAFAGAALWQLTRMRKRALMECHRSLPLAPKGWRADRDCLRYGSAIGAACVQTCWPLMLGCMLSGHSLIAMAGGMIVGAGEQWPTRMRFPVAMAGTLALAAYYTALAGLR